MDTDDPGLTILPPCNSRVHSGLINVASQCLSEGLSEISHHADVHRDVIFLRSACKGERVVLEKRDLRATQEDVLTSLDGGFLLFDLNLHDIAGMLNNLADVCFVTATDFAPCTFSKIQYSSKDPEAPEDSDGAAKGWPIGLDHAKRSVERPEKEEDEEQMVGVPKSLEILATRSFHSSDSHCHEAEKHDVAGPAGSGGKVGQQPAFETEAVSFGESGKVVPVGDGMKP